MRFKMPESLDGLSLDEITALHDAALDEATELNEIADDVITDDQVDELVSLADSLAVLADAQSQLEAADQARADKLAAARNQVTEASAPVDDPEADAAGDEEDDEGDQPDENAGELDDAEAEQDKELVTASAARKSTVRRAASKAPRPADIAPPAQQGSIIVAAANLPRIESQTQFDSLSHAASIWGERSSKGAGGSTKALMNYEDTTPVMELTSGHTRLGFAKIKRPSNTFGITEGMTVEQQLAVIDAAADEKLRFGSGGLAKAVLAAASGGWCAPSETIYDFCSYETVTGLLDVPTVNLPRGGIRYSKGPDYATLAATWGFLQTETQADAGTAKVCYDVPCPPFVETRLDAIGFCIKAGVLTNAAYPELIRRVLELGAVAHAHKVNAYVIGKISTAIGAAINAIEVGSSTLDLLDAVDLQALRIRYTLSMAETATLEVVLPIWAKGIIRADLSRRTGQDMIAVSDAQINSYFSARGVRVQWVYDYQPLTATNTTSATIPWAKLPIAVEFMMYPAGAFIKGALDVIDLDTIYDSVGLSTNTYTAAFFEEGVQVFNRCGFGVKVSVATNCTTGQTGAASLTCVPTP